MSEVVSDAVSELISPSQLVTIAVYKFVRLKNRDELRARFRAFCSALDLKGTILLADEGVNCFLAGEKKNIDAFKEFLEKEIGVSGLSYKEHVCLKPPFNRLLVKLKKEIISMGQPDIEPENFTAPYLSAEQLKEWLDQNKDIVLMDTRNDYEIQFGTFDQAVKLDLETFRSFPQTLEDKVEELPEDQQSEYKDKTFVTFCTGGIRCEKAAAYMLKKGFKNVYQLDGGILKYFEKCGGEHYQGDCFVFDWRVAVDPQLKPMKRTEKTPLTAGRHKIVRDLS